MESEENRSALEYNLYVIANSGNMVTTEAAERV